MSFVKCKTVKKPLSKQNGRQTFDTKTLESRKYTETPFAFLHIEPVYFLRVWKKKNKRSAATRRRVKVMYLWESWEIINAKSSHSKSRKSQVWGKRNGEKNTKRALIVSYVNLNKAVSEKFYFLLNFVTDIIMIIFMCGIYLMSLVL